jgi:hypothetical protein
MGRNNNTNDYCLQIFVNGVKRQNAKNASILVILCSFIVHGKKRFSL